ncbi:MAG: TolC family protein [Planctomycetia bacterium]|nr:TolC family protein [Planctomycetia bacterium]
MIIAPPPSRRRARVTACRLGMRLIVMGLLGLSGCTTTSSWRNSSEKELGDVAAVSANENVPAKRSQDDFRTDDVALASDDAVASPSDGALINTEYIITGADMLGSGPVRLAAVLEFAKHNHPQLASIAQEIDLARAERLGAGLFANPQLVMDADGAVDGDDAPSLTTRIDFTVPIGHKRQRGMSAADAAEQRARGELDYETDLVLLEVSNAAAEVLYLQELAEQQQYLSDLNLRFANMQNERAKQNVITEVDRLLADTSAKEAEFERLQSLTELEQARLVMAQAMGMTNPRPLELADRLQTVRVPAVPLERVIAVAREVRPEFRAGNWGIREQQRRTDLARAEAIPDLTLSPRYNEAFNDDNDNLGARFATDLLLWNFNQGEIAAGLASTRQARADLRLSESTTLGEVARAYALLAPMERQLIYYDEQVAPSMQASIASIEQAFEVQAIDAAELSQQLSRLAKLRRAHLELRYLHHQTRMQLEILLKRPLSALATEQIGPGRPAGEFPSAALLPK